jgi:hypothetical protein
MDKDDSIGALWAKFDTRGRPFFTGVVNGVNIVVFQNTKTNDRQPDWRIKKSKPKEDVATTRTPDPVPPPDDDDLGF